MILKMILKIILKTKFKTQTYNGAVDYTDCFSADG